jgi:hypothetical protein
MPQVRAHHHGRQEENGSTVSEFAEQVAFNRGQYLEAIILVLEGEPFARPERLGAVEYIIKQYKESEYYDGE